MHNASISEMVTLIRTCPGWIAKWLDGHGYMHSYKQKQAVKVLSDLTARYPGNAALHVDKGEMQLHVLDSETARQTLERAYELDPYICEGQDTLAFILRKRWSFLELCEPLHPISCCVLVVFSQYQLSKTAPPFFHV